MTAIRIDLIFLFLTVLTGFYTFRFAANGYQRLLPFFLLITLIVETAGEFIKSSGKPNVWIYNLFSVVEFLFFTTYFKSVLRGKVIKMMTYSLQIILPVTCLINILLVQGIGRFHTFTYAAGCIVMVILSIVHLSQIYRNSEIKNPIYLVSFWVTCAILFFFTTSVTIIGVFNYLAVLSNQLIQLYKTVLLTINCIFYSLFIIAFLCQKNSLKSTYNS